MKILYDGWSLVYQPNNPQAIHLLTLLEVHPPEIPADLALPGVSFHALPEGLHHVISACPDSDTGRLDWEQRRLPEIARSAGAAIHSPGTYPALMGGAIRVISPAGFAEINHGSAGRPQRGLTARLREALAQGGLSRTRAQLWPDDLPAPENGPLLQRLPPVVHPLFTNNVDEIPQLARAEIERLELPEDYILAHGPTDDRGMCCLLDAWSWAAGSIGEAYPLLLAGCDPAAGVRFSTWLANYGLTGSSRPLPWLSLDALAEVYRRAKAIFHPWDSLPWADPQRLALSCSRPLVGMENAATAALVGQAGYLTPSGGSYIAERRWLGAALLSVIVEDSLAENLALAASARSQSWKDILPFRKALRTFYHSIG